MKIWMTVSVLALVGCSQITQYQQVAQQPAPIALQGVWQTQGQQSGLVSPYASAQLLIRENGETLDCRQWQRVIAKPGKYVIINGHPANINRQLRVMPLTLQQETLHYDKLILIKVARLTPECQQAAEAVASHPLQDTIQNIPLQRTPQS